MTPATVRPATTAEWDAAWLEDPTATYFQSRAWSEAWEVATRGRMRSDPIWIEGAGCSGVIPVTIDSRVSGLVTIARLSPASTWGGVLAGQEDEPLRDAAARFILHEYRSIEWVISAFGPEPSDWIPVTGRGHTSVVVLDQPLELVRSRWRKGHVSASAQARRAGVTVDQARGTDDWRAYFEVYLDSLRRWGSSATSRYEWALFEALASGADARVRLWLARVGGEVAAGAICFDGRDVVHYWHGAALERHFAARPVNLLMETVIRDACERGMAAVDLGPSGGHEGVERFKHGFAPTERPFAVVYREPPGAGLARRLRRRVTG